MSSVTSALGSPRGTDGAEWTPTPLAGKQRQLTWENTIYNLETQMKRDIKEEEQNRSDIDGEKKRFGLFSLKKQARN